MPASRIFVSYAPTGDERGTEIASRIITDLRSNGADVVTADERISDEHFMAFLNRELPQCHYLLFIQTPATLKSLRVQAAVSIALTLAARHQTPRVLRLIAASSSEEHEAQPLWNAVCTFDASVDYARACAKLFLDLGLIRLEESSPFLPIISSTLPDPHMPRSAPLPGIPSSSGNLAPLSPSGFPSSSGSLPPMPRTGFPPSSGSLPPMSQSGFSQAMPAHSGQLTAVGVQPSLAAPAPIGQKPLQADPYSNPATTSRPLSAPASLPQSTSYQISGDGDKPVSLRRESWLKHLAFFPRVWQGLLTRLSQAPFLSGKQTMEVTLNNDDRPLPLNTPRQRVIRWVSALVLVLALIAGTTVILAQARNHPPSRRVLATATAPLSQHTLTPSATSSSTGTPQSFPTQGIMVLKPDPRGTIDPYGKGGALTLNDTLVGNDATYQWQVAGGCQFKNNGYDLLATGPHTCLASKSNFSNFVYQTEITLVQGTTAGLIFRMNSTKHTGYFFQIAANGDFSLWRIDSPTAPLVQIPKSFGSASAIRKGLNQPNVIAVIANGSNIICYVNNLQVLNTHDTTYPAGSVGVMSGLGKNSGLNEALYQYAKVWTLP